MSEKNVQDYLEKGMYGTPQLRPDEQRKYLGTFRERIYLSMTMAEIRDPKNLAYFKQELSLNPQQQVLINAAVSSRYQNDYMVAAQKANCPFKIVDTENQTSPEAIALVYISNEAVNVEVIAISEKYPLAKKTAVPSQKTSVSDTPPAKKSWLSRLFK